MPVTPQRKEKFIKELDPERNELFFSSRLLIVEGDTEKLAIPEYAKRLGLDIDREGSTIVEVGGKRNIPEFADISISLGIPTDIIYDADSSDIKDKEEEQEFNTDLDSRETSDGSVKVWRLENNYEDHLKKTFGLEAYGTLCNKFPKVRKPTRARLIAMEKDLEIPEPIEEVLSWLTGKIDKFTEEKDEDISEYWQVSYGLNQRMQN